MKLNISVRPRTIPTQARKTPHDRGLPCIEVGTRGSGGLPLFVRYGLLADLARYAVANPLREVGGVVLGHLGKDENGEFLEATAHLKARNASHGIAEMTFTTESLKGIHYEKERLFPDERVLGWFHTHPGYGLFLSGTDLFTHRNWFREPHHIAMVLDPRKPLEEMARYFPWLGPDEIAEEPYGFTLFEDGEDPDNSERADRAASGDGPPLGSEVPD